MKVLSRRYTKIIIAAVIVMVIIFTGIIIHNSVAAANENTKYYKSILIKDGDTLWDIADMNHADGVSTKDYLDDICSINGITNKSHITSGSYLTIYYYK